MTNERRNALLKRRTDALCTRTNGDNLHIGFLGDERCENEVIMMKLDVLARNGPPLLVTKFGVDRYNDKHGSL